MRRLTKPRFLVRSTIRNDGVRRWQILERTGLITLPYGFPFSRQFKTWPEALHAANHLALNNDPYLKGLECLPPFRAAIDACTQCDDLGYVKVANGTVAKCTHQPMKGPF